jgi:hypothetical protein
MFPEWVRTTRPLAQRTPVFRLVPQARQAATGRLGRLPVPVRRLGKAGRPGSHCLGGGGAGPVRPDRGTITISRQCQTPPGFKANSTMLSRGLCTCTRSYVAVLGFLLTITQESPIPTAAALPPAEPAY